MKKTKQIFIIDVIENIYNSEIPCRIEWMFDSGFTWSIQDNNYPRIWKDNYLQDNIKIIAESDINILLKNNPLLEVDWIERGFNPSFYGAVIEMANAICKHYPKSIFAEWFLKNKL